MLTFHALKHSLSSAANWSSALGGPRISTIKRACKPRINILPFIDSENLAAHIRQYKEILKKYNNVLDFSKVPLQAYKFPLMPQQLLEDFKAANCNLDVQITSIGSSME